MYHVKPRSSRTIKRARVVTRPLAGSKHPPQHEEGQSAMEYLMTYGWAILVIAVALAALFELGVFNGAGSVQTCIAQAGFVCKNPVYTTQGIGFTLGQTKGSTYYGNWVFVAAQGEPLNQQGIPQNFTIADAVQLGTTQNGHALQTGQTTFVVLPSTHFQQGQIPYNAPIGTQFAGYVWLGYCNTQPCTAPVAYAKVATLIVKETGTQSLSGSAPTATGVSCTPSSFAIGSSSSCTASVTGLSPTGTVSWTQSGSGSVSFSASQCTLSSSSCGVTVTGSSAGSVTITASYGGDASNGASSGTASVSVTVPTVYNPTNYDGTANVEYNSPVTLNGNVRTTGTITIDGGVTVTTNGYWFVAGGAFTNSGTINTGTSPSGQSFPNSYGGSGAGSHRCHGGSQSGYSTLTSGGGAGGCGSGGSGSTPSLSASTVQSNANSWFSSPQQYLAGAWGATPGSAGSGAYGIYIQGNSISPGTINAVGGNSGGGSPDGGAPGKGGPGGGGAIILAYGNGGLSSGSLSNAGGSFTGWCYRGNQCNGVRGGSGAMVSFNYGSNPPVPP